MKPAPNTSQLLYTIVLQLSVTVPNQTAANPFNFNPGARRRDKRVEALAKTFVEMG